ncbi:outer-membrane lipoprotein carrier protein LolA, partial [uncultured Alsobacter sp.]|uniref:outer-membrane lipoprotein carrier protein LolA n=1 Tax=uncultured Alsobacter sp. TaxID=1748258 RepID=UPI00345D181D
AIPMPIPRPANLGGGTAQAASEAPRAVAIPTAPAAAPQVVPAAIETTPEAALQRANAALNALGQMQADFVQTSGNGRRAEGKIYLQKPGRVRFEYLPPATLEIVADGSSVVIRDRKLGTQDLYGIAQTPLKFLLRDKVDLSRDMRLLEINPAPDLVSVTVEDKATFGGTSRIELFFDPRSYALKQWTVTDPQGYQTAVVLRNVDTRRAPDPANFFIDYTKSMPAAGGAFR